MADKEAVEKAKRDGYAIDLRNADLSGDDLSGYCLEIADLTNANLKRANLSIADLTNTNFYEARCRGANFSESNMRKAHLEGADFSDTDLYHADMRGITAYGADFSESFLLSADLRDASLTGVKFNYSTLCEARLEDTNLIGASFYKADLDRTCLDPRNTPNGRIEEFHYRDGKNEQYVVGFRTRTAGHIWQYLDDQVYAADWFSTADTACHPGLYLNPRPGIAGIGLIGQIAVRTWPKDIHNAGSKYRCRWFHVIGDARTFLEQRGDA